MAEPALAHAVRVGGHGRRARAGRRRRLRRRRRRRQGAQQGRKGRAPVRSPGSTLCFPPRMVLSPRVSVKEDASLVAYGLLEEDCWKRQPRVWCVPARVSVRMGPSCADCLLTPASLPLPPLTLQRGRVGECISDIRFIHHFDSSALGLVRRRLLIAYFLIHLLPPPSDPGDVHPTPHTRTTLSRAGEQPTQLTQPRNYIVVHHYRYTHVHHFRYEHGDDSTPLAPR